MSAHTLLNARSRYLYLHEKNRWVPSGTGNRTTLPSHTCSGTVVKIHYRGASPKALPPKLSCAAPASDDQLWAVQQALEAAKEQELDVPTWGSYKARSAKHGTTLDKFASIHHRTSRSQTLNDVTISADRRESEQLFLCLNFPFKKRLRQRRKTTQKQPTHFFYFSLKASTRRPATVV